MLRLIEVEPRPGYRLPLKYADGVAGEVDLSHLVGKGVFRLWNSHLPSSNLYSRHRE